MAQPIAERMARDIVQRLVEDTERLLPKLPKAWPLPLTFFRSFINEEDIAATKLAVERGICSNPTYVGSTEYLCHVLSACAHCAQAVRLQGDDAWLEVVNAERHAGVALAILVSSAEARERKTLLARAAKSAQTAVNSKFRMHVLELAAAFQQLSANSIANNIVRRIERDHGGDLKVALEAYGSNLQPDAASLARTIADYVRHDRKQVQRGASEETGPPRKVVR